MFSKLMLNTARRMVYPFAPELARGLGVPLTAVTLLIAVNQATAVLGPLGALLTIPAAGLIMSHFSWQTPFKIVSITFLFFFADKSLNKLFLNQEGLTRPQSFLQYTDKTTVRLTINNFGKK